MRTTFPHERVLASITVALLLLPAVAGAQERPSAPADTGRVGVGQHAEHIFVDPANLQWQPAPAVLPPGAQVAVIEGDPSQRGLFTMRVRFPDGYRIGPHFHGADEHVTVLSGTFVVGVGESWDDSAGTAIPAGGFAVMPAGMRHFAQARGETVLQIHAVGPWTLTYVNPSDDPRQSAPPER